MENEGSTRPEADVSSPRGVALRIINRETRHSPSAQSTHEVNDRRWSQLIAGDACYSKWPWTTLLRSRVGWHVISFLLSLPLWILPPPPSIKLFLWNVQSALRVPPPVEQLLHRWNWMYSQSWHDIYNQTALKGWQHPMATGNQSPGEKTGCCRRIWITKVYDASTWCLSNCTTKWINSVIGILCKDMETHILRKTCMHCNEYFRFSCLWNGSGCKMILKACCLRLSGKLNSE